MKPKGIIITYAASIFAGLNCILQAAVFHDYFRAIDQLTIGILFWLVARLMTWLDKSLEFSRQASILLDRLYRTVIELKKRDAIDQILKTTEI